MRTALDVKRVVNLPQRKESQARRTLIELGAPKDAVDAFIKIAAPKEGAEILSSKGRREKQTYSQLVTTLLKNVQESGADIAANLKRKLPIELPAEALELPQVKIKWARPANDGPKTIKDLVHQN